MTNFFISSSPKDKKYTDPLQDMLTRAGFKVWVDPSPRPGQDWRFAIDEAIRASDAVLVAVTPNSADSVYVTYEWTFAVATGIRVIPIIFQPARLHPRLETMERFDMGGFREPASFWDYFLREIRRLFPYQRSAGVPAPMPIASSLPSSILASNVPAPAPILDRSVMPPTRGFWLVMRKGLTPNMMWRFDGQTVTLGRDKTNDISIDDVGVSRFHCRFTQFPEGYAVEDNKSTNGVIVNGSRIQGIVPLFAGMVVQLGDNIILTYEVVP